MTRRLRSLHGHVVGFSPAELGGILQVALAMLLGAIIGVDREWARNPLGSGRTC